MLKAYDLKCPKCGETLSDLLEFDADTHQITEEVLCPNMDCGAQMVPQPTNDLASGDVHSSAGRWNDHNMVG